jgi:hypothetical protein
MTAPRWIAEALDASLTRRDEEADVSADELAAALIERLPIEAMYAAGCALRPEERTVMGIVRAAMGVLSDGDPEVVELTELYQAASRALDDAGVPYAVNTAEVYLAGRIRWLAEQRPTRLDLQRVEAERDLARAMHQDAERAFADAKRGER